MNQSISAICSDSAFGPVLKHSDCRENGFDFTLLFEETIFAILPAGLLLCAIPGRLRSISRRPIAVRWSLLPSIKLTFIVILGLLDLALLVLWALPRYAAYRTYATIAATAMDFVAVLAISILSPLEHTKSSRPSILISVYLLVTTMFDIARARTNWNLRSSSTIPSIFTIALIVKLGLLVLEALSKTKQTQKPATPELTSNLYSLTFFAWLNPLILLGNRCNLTIQDLYSLDDSLASERAYHRVNKQWSSNPKDKKNSLAWAITKALWVSLASTMVPRLALIGFSMAQPFLIQEAILFVENDTKPPRYGYGLIGAFGLTYLGIAVSTAWYQYLTARALSMIRAALIGLIYHSSLEITVDAAQKASPISLMGADVERIMARLRWVISTAPNVVQMILAIWILGTRLGPICVAPIVVVLILAYTSSQVAKKIRPRQQQWMQAVQKRIALTTNVLGSMKGMKMLGFTKLITNKVQSTRDQELERSKKFRYVQIINITLGNAGNMLSPIVTLIGYGIVINYSSVAPNAATIFSSLSLLSVLMSPVDELIAAMPNLTMALESCSRIQRYLTEKQVIDFRNLANVHLGFDASRKTMVELDRVTAGWTTSKEVLQDLSIRICTGDLTMIIGPSGCGKSTLLQIMLGEGTLYQGSVNLTTFDIAYCNQTPFLMNRSVKDNIVGNLDFDAKWFTMVVQACALESDITKLPDGCETMVGSRGIALSGGQKQRLALARAVYARKDLVLLDDCLSGLDAVTEWQCFQQLFGSDGLLRRNGTTAVLVTQTAKWLRYADHIIALNANGCLSQSGSLQSLVSVPGYVADLGIQVDGVETPRPIPSQAIESNKSGANETVVQKHTEEQQSEDRGRRDPQNLLYYINTMGKGRLLLFLGLVAGQVIFTAIQPLWLSWWIDAKGRRSHSDYAMWLGVYALFGILALACLGVSGGYYLISMIPTSASVVHYSLLRTTMNAPMNFLSSVDSGSLLNRFTQDMTSMDMELPMTLLLFSGGFGNTIAGAVLTCVSSGYLALCLPLLGASLFYLQKFYLRTSRQLRLLDLEAKSPLYTHLTETLDGGSTIRAFGWTRFSQERHFQLLDLAQRPFYLLLCLQNWLNLALDIAVAFLAVILIVLVVTLRHTINGNLLGVALTSIVTFGQTMSILVKYWSGLETALGAVARTRHFIRDTPQEGIEVAGDKSAAEWPSDLSIDFQNVSASYQPTGPTVLRNITISIPAGHRVAICGRTGSGKSTFAALMLRLLEPSSGSISIGGKDISLLVPDTVRMRLNSLPQDPWFLPGAWGTSRSNLDPLSDATDAEIRSAITKTGLNELIEKIGGLDADMRGDNLSSGQRQLFCLARAMLVRREKILILDEATSSVDQHTEELMMDLLRTEFKGWTVVAIAHRLGSILDFDQVLVFDEGRIAEMGSPKALLADGDSAFSNLYQHSLQ